MPNYEQSRNGYKHLWDIMQVRSSWKNAADRVARRIISDRERYLDVENATGVPWFFVGMLHDRESGGDFSGVLHNGEHIIGTGRKTRLEPKGRGPFGSWQEAAVDALRIKGLHKIGEWPVERLGYEGERFNGFGYMGKNVNSPYLWSGSNLYSRGKYVADGVWDSSAVDKQLGIMVILASLAELSSEVHSRLATEEPEEPAPLPPRPGDEVGSPRAEVEIPPMKSLTKSKTIWGGIWQAVTSGFLSVLAYLQGMPPWLVVFLVVVIAIGLYLVIKGRIDVQDIMRKLHLRDEDA